MEQKNHHFILLTDLEWWAHHYRIIINNINGIFVCHSFDQFFFLFFVTKWQIDVLSRMKRNTLKYVESHFESETFVERAIANKNRFEMKLLFDVKSIWIFIDSHRLVNGLFMATLANNVFCVMRWRFGGVYTE